jgi:hypothetical protein
MPAGLTGLGQARAEVLAKGPLAELVRWSE